MIKIILAFSILLSFQLSAEDNKSTSKSNLELGVMYYTGDGKKKDIKKAKKHFKKACENRVSKACFYLGFVLLRGGDGVEINKKNAMQSFSRACSISEHDEYCNQYYKLRDQGYKYAK